MRPRIALLLISGVLAPHWLWAQPLPEFVTVGNPNNLADTNGWPAEFGSIPYSYKIGKYETKVSEYVAFLNSAATNSDTYGLYASEVGFFIDRSAGPPFTYSAKTGASNKPVGGVSWLAAARYANWLHNGATNGSSTESGAYDLNGATNGLFFKNAGARYWIPSEAEWYKAAYYDPTLNGGLGGYWKYPTRSNSITTNQANFNLTLVSLSSIRDVGSYGVPSYFGTFDQAGNLEETVSEDSLVYYDNLWLGNRGGSFNSSGTNAISSFQRGVWADPNYENFSSMMYGIRLAAAVTTNVSSVTNSLEFVRVDQTNAAAHSSGYGFVGYPYEISKYEITIDQYAAFLNAVAKSDLYGLFDTNMASFTGVRGIQRQGTSGNYSYVLRGTGNRPITYINWFRAARFANWLHNGATTSPASTETGAYPLNGNTNTIVAAASNALYRLPTENEWFKAAYFDLTNNRYWNYPTRSDTPPLNNLWGMVPIATYSNNGSFTLGNNPAASDNKLTGVGQTRSPSGYGTYDQGGNVCEWVDNQSQLPYGVMRGGSWGRDASAMHVTNRDVRAPGQAWSDYGFRLVKPLSTTNNASSVQINRILNQNLGIGDLLEVEGRGLLKAVGIEFFGGATLRVYPEAWSDTNISFRTPTLAKSGPITIYFLNESNEVVSTTTPSINVQTPLEKFRSSLGLASNEAIVPWSGQSVVSSFFRGATNPAEAGRNRLIQIEEERSLFQEGRKRLKLTIQKNAQAPELDYWIEKSVSLSNSNWTSLPLESTVSGSSNGVETVVFRDTVDSTAPRNFYRLGFRATEFTNPTWRSQGSLSQRLAAVGFPKIFRAWNEGTDPLKANLFSGSHDLAWESVSDLRWNHLTHKGLGTDLIAADWDYLIQWKREILQKNPNMILLAELTYFEFWEEELPEASPFWLRDTSSNRIAHWSDSGAAAAKSTYCLDFSRADLQDHIAVRAAHLVSRGVFDGVFIDWWSEPVPSEGYGFWKENARPSTYPSVSTNLALLERTAKTELLQKIRDAVGTNKLIIANMNYGKYFDAPIGPKLITATNLDGVYMELFYEPVYPTNGIAPFSTNAVTPLPYFSKPGEGDPTKSRWRKAEEFISYAEKSTNLFRSQPLNCIEFQFRWASDDPRDLKHMRGSQALVLTCSDSYYLFCEPNFWRIQTNAMGEAMDRPDHMHDWKTAWNKNLGHPVEAKRDPVNDSQKNINGTYSRAFDQGIVFYNPPANPSKTLVFAKPVKSVASGVVSTSHSIGEGPDGDIFLLTQPGDPR